MKSNQKHTSLSEIENLTGLIGELVGCIPAEYRDAVLIGLCRRQSYREALRPFLDKTDQPDPRRFLWGSPIQPEDIPQEFPAATALIRDCLAQRDLVGIWSAGRIIAELQNTAKYGDGVVDRIAAELKITSRICYDYGRFAEMYPDPVPLLELGLSWSMIRATFRIDDPEQRMQLLREAAVQHWGVRAMRSSRE